MTYPKPSIMKPKTPVADKTRNREPKTKPVQEKKLNYDVTLANGEKVVMRGVHELEIVEAVFEKYGAFPLLVRKTAFKPKERLTDRPFNNPELLKLKKKLEKAGK